MEDIVRGEIGAILGDDSLVEYVAGMLADAPNEAESSEAIVDFLTSASDPPLEEADAAAASSKLFAALRAAGFGEPVASGGESSSAAGGGAASQASSKAAGSKSKEEDLGVTRLLATKVVIGKQDSSGLSYGDPGDDGNYSSKGSKVLVGMRDAGGPLEATSAKAERKKAQERKRAARKAQLEEEARTFEAQIKHEMSLATGAGEEQLDDLDGLDEDAAEMDGTGSAFARDVHLRGFDLENKRGAGQLLVNADLSLASGRRYGLLGRNGCGKTTFMEAMASRELKGVPARMSMLLVKQEIVGVQHLSGLEVVLRSDARREALRRTVDKLEKEQAGLEEALSAKDKSVSKGKDAEPFLLAQQQKAEQVASALDALYLRREELDDLSGGAPEPRARKVLQGLGFTDALLSLPTASLSGGWRMRVALACALFSSPQLLLLDEPTNHLDLEAVLWLEAYLTADFKGTLLVVSHDRSFLDTVVTDIVSFDRQRRSLKVYKGDVTNFEAVRADEKQRDARAAELQKERKAHLQKFIDGGNSANVKAAKQRKSKMKKLERVGVEEAGDGKKWKLSQDRPAEEMEVELLPEEAPVELAFPDPGPFDKPIVRLSDASFAYELTAAGKRSDDLDDDSDEDEEHGGGSGAVEKPPPPPPPQAGPLLLANVDFQVTSKSRIALLGRNGCGKSTLIKILVGQLRPNRGGECLIDLAAKTEYIAQHQLDQLDALGTPLSTLLDRYPGDSGATHAHLQKLRQHLGKFGLGGETLPSQKIHTLSGGQKCRVCLAAAMYRRPHLLILDEPTNHLDLETTDALVQAIKTFQGGVVVVSHDQHLLSTACDELWCLQGGGLSRLDHGFTQYKKDVIAGRR